MARRRKHQRGYIFKRGKHGKKVWVARWREGVILEDGTRGSLHRSLVLGPVKEVASLTEAKTRLDERLRLLNQGLQRPQSTKRFCNFVQSEWTSLLLPTLKLSTQRGYRMIVRKHLLPYFGDSRLCDISKSDIQHFVLEKFRHRLAWQTVRNAWIVLSSILEAAVDHDYLAANPARGVKFPPQAPKRKLDNLLSVEAFTSLLAHLSEPFKTMVVLAALTGFRIGELLALRWRVVNLDTGTLEVSESVFQGHFQKPKSEKSVRIVPIGPVVRSLLENHFRRSALVRPDDLLFPNRKGGPYWDSNLLERELRPAGEAAGIGRVTWHQFRHFHSSLLHDLGVPGKVVQQQLGHASVETTLNTYTHVLPATHREAIANLECLLFPNVLKSGNSGQGGGLVIQ